MAGVKVGRSQSAIVAERATHGRRALRVEFPPARYPGIVFRIAEREDIPADWRGFDALSLDLFLDRDRTRPLYVNVRGPKPADAKRAPYYLVIVNPAPRKLCRVWIDLAAMRLGVDQQDGPSSRNVVMRTGRCHGLVSRRVEQVSIVLRDLEEPTTLCVDNVRLVGDGKAPPFLIDRFGQIAVRNWPGKISSVEQLKAHWTAEQAEFDRRQRSSALDPYGGIKGRARKATGFFRVERIDGRWWLITPDGNLFYSLGVCAARIRGTRTSVVGREDLFEWIPSDAGEFRPACIRSRWGNGPSFYIANLIRGYGKDYYKHWCNRVLARLRHWGFNTLGSWCDPALWRQKKMPYTVPIIAYAVYTRQCPKVNANVPDVFDDAFPKAIAGQIAKCDEYRDDAWLLGYFIDNELDWTTYAEPHEPVLTEQIMRPPRERAAKRALVEFVRKRYDGNVGKLNAAWRTRLSDFDALYTQPPENAYRQTAAAKADYSDFLRMFAERYFQIVTKMVRERDPNHLILGCRFSRQRPKEVVEVAGKYVDVMSSNIYDYEAPRDVFDEFYRVTGKPFLIGEFGFGAPEGGSFSGGNSAAHLHRKADRAQCYRHYVETLIADVPYFVGCHWFKFYDYPASGIPGLAGSPNFNLGIVDACDNPYESLAGAMRRTNGRVFDLALGRTEPARGLPTFVEQRRLFGLPRR